MYNLCKYTRNYIILNVWMMFLYGVEITLRIINKTILKLKEEKFANK